RIALRLPALCGLPTRAEAEQVLDVSVAKQHEVTGQVISLTKQRREVLGHPERLERLSITQGPPQVELIASPQNRSNHQNIVESTHGCPQSCCTLSWRKAGRRRRGGAKQSRRAPRTRWPSCPRCGGR